MKILGEMKRRNVFRIGMAYIVGAWVVLQVAATFFPAWGIPDTALRYLIIAVLFDCLLKFH